MNRSFITAVLLLMVGVLSAQTRYTVTGTMVDSLNKEKIFYATIGLMTQDSTPKMVGNTYSDATGKFTLTDIPAGTYNLKASLVGYDLLVIPVTVGGEQKTVNLGDVYLKKVSGFLQEVTVRGEKPVYMQDGEKTLYNVSKDPTVQSGTASDALQNAPGVEVDVEGNITLRGVSSVEIWLNNKPSNMNEEALKQFIQQMPAGTIEKIEVITNPSARYTAKGSGGIINIVTSSKIKRNSFSSFGVRGSSTPDVSPFLSYVYANEKFSISTYLHYSYNINKNDNQMTAIYLNDSLVPSSYFKTYTKSRNVNHRCGVYINGSYTPDTMNTLSFWAGGYPSVSNSLSSAYVNRYEFIDNPGNYSYLSDSYSPSNNVGGGGYGGLWFEHKFNSKGHKISFDVSGSGYGSKWNDINERDYLTDIVMDRFRKTYNNYSNTNLNASVDYTIPYHKDGEIELGVSGSYGNSHDISQLDTLVAGTIEEFQKDLMRSYACIGNDGSFEAYATLQHRFGNFTLKGGLRTEYEHFNLTYEDAPYGDVNKGYWGLYPSLHLSYRTESMHNFKLSYTRRVNNPSANDLSPYMEYGEDAFSTGNPNLRQSFTNSVEAGWSKFFQKFGNIGLNAYFRNSKDEFDNIEDVIYDPFFGRIVSFSKPVNAGKTLNTGAEFNMMYRLKAFMNIRFYANVSYTQSEFMFRDNETYKIDNVGYSFRLNFWAKAWKFLEINASANYRSKSKTLFTVSRPNYSIDCGLRAEFWKKRISVNINVNDIFNWNKWTNDNTNPYLTSSSTMRSSWMGRSIRAGITFKFGKMELEGQQAQQMGGGGM